MATKRRIILPTIGTPAAGKTFTIMGKMNLRYHQIIIEYCDNFSGASRIVGTDGAGGVASTLLNDIRVMVNQKAMRTHSAFELDALNKSNGAQYAYQQSGAGATLKQRLVIFFAEPWRKNPADMDALAFSVTEANGIDKDSFKIEIDLAALAGNTGAVAPTISAYAVVDDVIVVPGGQLVNKVYRQQIVPGGSSAVDLPVPVKDWLQAVFLRHPSTAGLITKVTLKRNGVTINELPADTNGSWLTNLDTLPLESPAVTGYNVQGGFGYTLMLDSDDPINSALAMKDPNGIAYDFDLHIDLSAGGTGNMYALYQKLGKLD
jgi:hypothetical protein